MKSSYSIFTRWLLRKVLLSNRCYAIKIYNGIKIYNSTISKNVHNVILDICAKFGAISTNFCTNRPDCR